MTLKMMEVLIRPTPFNGSNFRLPPDKTHIMPNV